MRIPCFDGKLREAGELNIGGADPSGGLIELRWVRKGRWPISQAKEAKIKTVRVYTSQIQYGDGPTFWGVIVKWKERTLLTRAGLLTPVKSVVVLGQHGEVKTR